ncbi:MAG: hypothetical protein DWQ19_12475 [Crenarchaeota archaeon]|nr:MAG: hypothetical protein DWQ19_12475 [Thermoproteota archaeon]
MRNKMQTFLEFLKEKDPNFSIDESCCEKCDCDPCVCDDDKKDKKKPPFMKKKKEDKEDKG